jgi:hypothetical protein
LVGPLGFLGLKLLEGPSIRSIEVSFIELKKLKILYAAHNIKYKI